MGGASLDEPIKEGESLKINGSVMMVEADTREEVEQVIKEDIYYKEQVWDPAKVSPALSFLHHLRRLGCLKRRRILICRQVQIFPFKSAVREPLK